jgi:hypothetical protein
MKKINWNVVGDNHERMVLKIPIDNLTHEEIELIKNFTKKIVMEEKKLEYRMYGLVPYNLSPIQQGIQFGHAVVEYGLDNFNDPIYQIWAREYKTFIILNGGTTNTNEYSIGSLNKHLLTLNNLGVKVACFYEPDLGDQLTAVVFLVDERVFDEINYPNFDQYLKNLETFEADSKVLVKDTLALFDEWKESIGGDQIYNLRTFLEPFKKA